MHTLISLLLLYLILKVLGTIADIPRVPSITFYSENLFYKILMGVLSKFGFQDKEAKIKALAKQFGQTTIKGCNNM